MSCEDCEKVQNNGWYQVFYSYRWKEATVQIIGCTLHVKEIVDVLNRAQEGGDKAGARTDRGERA